jgi:ribonuclease E
VHRAEVQPPARSERKRRRGKGGQPSFETAPAAPAAVHHPEPSEAERHAKAEATRAALANIAAAAHAAHLHEEAAHSAAASGEAARPAAPAAAAPESPVVHRAPETESVSGRPGAVLTFGGEKVILPFVDHTEEPAKEPPALTLHRLEEAFAHLGAPAAPAEEEAPATALPASQQPEGQRATSQAVESPVAPSKSRRPRRNRSASRAQGAANETSVEHHEVAPVAAAGHSHEAKAPEAGNAQGAPKAAQQPASEPIILGVGVPASEL